MVGRFERNKDTAQEITESAATHVGNIAGIIAGAVRDITREVGDGISEAMEMYEAAQRAKADDGDAASTGEPLRDDLQAESPSAIDPKADPER